MKAVKQLGVFWAAVNEPTFANWREEAGVQNGSGVLRNKKRLNDETPPHSAFGG
jgi:hypothetical protein